MEAIGMAIGAVSLAFQAFQGCIQAISFFEVAQNIGVDGDLFRLGLDIQTYRLMRWGDRVGIWEEGRQNEMINWNLADSLLRQLQSFLTSAQKMARKYSLEVSEETIQEAEMELELAAPKRGLSKALAMLKPDISPMASRIIKSSNSTLKRLKWATLDRDRAKRIIEVIEDLVDSLELLLDSTHRAQRDTEDAQLYRALVSLAKNTDEAGHMRDILEEGRKQEMKDPIGQAAWAKQVRLVLGADKREDEIQPKGSSKIRRFMPELRKRKKPVLPWNGNTLSHQGIEFATYDEQQVLMQWKVAEGDEWDKYIDNVKHLVVLLQSLSHQSFRVLPCYGYHPAKNLGRHGIIFSLPDNSTTWAYKTLQQLIAEEKCVSLTKRASIGLALMEAILQLHTAGWMHKNLRPENIIFFSSKDSINTTYLDQEPYIMGYDYARPDSTAGASLTQLAGNDPYSDLYRHPSSLGPHRETYQKRFDMYALGCIMIELAFWEPLLKLHSRPPAIDWVEKFTIAVKDNSTVEIPSALGLLEDHGFLQLLQHRAGTTLSEIVVSSIRMKKVSVEDEADISEEIELVDKLSRCVI